MAISSIKPSLRGVTARFFVEGFEFLETAGSGPLLFGAEFEVLQVFPTSRSNLWSLKDPSSHISPENTVLYYRPF